MNQMEDKTASIMGSSVEISVRKLYTAFMVHCGYDAWHALSGSRFAHLRFATTLALQNGDALEGGRGGRNHVTSVSSDDQVSHVHIRKRKSKRKIEKKDHTDGSLLARVECV